MISHISIGTFDTAVQAAVAYARHLQSTGGASPQEVVEEVQEEAVERSGNVRIRKISSFRERRTTKYPLSAK